MIYFLLLCADIVWGLNVVVTKLNYHSFHPIFLIFFKLLFSFLAMCFILYYKHEKIEKIVKKDLLINANLINVINFLLTYYALKNIGGVDVATINCLAPVVMAIITFLYQKSIDKKIIFFLFFSIFGFLCTIHFQIDDISMSHILSILALFVYNLGNYRLKDQKETQLILYNTMMLFISFIEITVIALFFKKDIFMNINTLYLWLYILTAGLGYAFIQVVYFYSIVHIGPLKTSLFLGVNPLFTYLFSIIILKENIDYYMIAGFIIILSSSLYMMYKSKNDKQKI